MTRVGVFGANGRVGKLIIDDLKITDINQLFWKGMKVGGHL